MTSLLNSVKSAAITLSLVALSPMAQANGEIVFTSTTSVPTLSEWGMSIMALILVGLAYRTLRQGRYGGTPLALLLGTAIFAAGVAGDGMLASAMNTNVIMCATPGRYSLPSNNLYTLTNSSSGPLTVQSLTGTNYADGNNCVIGMTLSVGQSCNAQIVTYQ